MLLLQKKYKCLELFQKCIVCSILSVNLFSSFQILQKRVQFKIKSLIQIPAQHGKFKNLKKKQDKNILQA
jgi:hypothetical protein